MEGGPAGPATFEPGWQWSKPVKPIAKTASCQAAHMGYFVSGRMRVVMDDGEGAEFGSGDFMICPPGPDACIVGDEACVGHRLARRGRRRQAVGAGRPFDRGIRPYRARP